MAAYMEFETRHTFDPSVSSPQYTGQWAKPKKYACARVDRFSSSSSDKSAVVVSDSLNISLNSILVDSGASRHIVTDKKSFTKLTEISEDRSDKYIIELLELELESYNCAMLREKRARQFEVKETSKDKK